MTFLELLNAIKESNLTKTDLENLRDEMAHLYSLYQIETASIKKAKAFFTIENGEKTNVATENKWAITEQGQREIQLKYECNALKEELSSIKHRLYASY